jgi:Uma2 family endonuclease
MVQTAEQVIPVRGANLWPMSVEAYHVLGEAGVIPENTELLYGLVYTKMPKSPLHSFLLHRFVQHLQRLDLVGLLIRAEQPLTFVDSEPDPDIAVVKGRNEDFRMAHPQTAEIVIEVCVTSYEYDRSKLRAYAMGNVKECWLVLASEEKVEVHFDPQGEAFRNVESHGPSGILQSRTNPPISIDLKALFQARSPVLFPLQSEVSQAFSDLRQVPELHAAGVRTND